MKGPGAVFLSFSGFFFLFFFSDFQFSNPDERSVHKLRRRGWQSCIEGPAHAVCLGMLLFSPLHDAAIYRANVRLANSRVEHFKSQLAPARLPGRLLDRLWVDVVVSLLTLCCL